MATATTHCFRWFATLVGTVWPGLYPGFSVITAPALSPRRQVLDQLLAGNESQQQSVLGFAVSQCVSAGLARYWFCPARVS